MMGYSDTPLGERIDEYKRWMWSKNIVHTDSNVRWTLNNYLGCAIRDNRQDKIIELLDYCGIPDGNLSTRERIALYRLNISQEE